MVTKDSTDNIADLKSVIKSLFNKPGGIGGDSRSEVRLVRTGSADEVRMQAGDYRGGTPWTPRPALSW